MSSDLTKAIPNVDKARSLTEAMLLHFHSGSVVSDIDGRSPLHELTPLEAKAVGRILLEHERDIIELSRGREAARDIGVLLSHYVVSASRFGISDAVPIDESVSGSNDEPRYDTASGLTHVASTGESW